MSWVLAVDGPHAGTLVEADQAPGPLAVPVPDGEPVTYVRRRMVMFRRSVWYAATPGLQGEELSEACWRAFVSAAAKQAEGAPASRVVIDQVRDHGAR